MMQFRSGEIVLQPGDVLYQEGEKNDHFFTAWEGQGARYHFLPNGDRQLVNFIFPGDVVGLQAVLSGDDPTVATATTPMILCRFERPRLGELFRENPDRAYALTWIAAIEQHFLGETIATLGQRTAIQRMAWALLKIHERLTAVGLAPSGKAHFPFKQRDLADAMGLSLVHTNKTLGKLRAHAQWDHDTLQILDRKALAEIAMVSDETPPERPLL